ncbi:dynein regulatory complex protein 10-like [Liolophura sinensis]|uniref:dynein regulatory complex protein 10-like n=1 Tax=Liolophura sinensis TaxID=3198878 RepID=UPI0031598D90
MASTVTRTLPPLSAGRQMETMHVRPNMANRGQGNVLSLQNSKANNRLRLDPARALEPARKKIATLEAQRVMTVFDETIKRSEIITLMPFVLENLSRFNVVFGSELVEALEQHGSIKNSYEEIRNQLEKIRRRREKSSDSLHSNLSQADQGEGHDVEDGESTGEKSRPTSQYSQHSVSASESQMDNVMRNLSFVAQQLSTSTKNVLRLFSVNPAAMSAVRAEVGERARECQSFITALEELKEVLLVKLLTTPVEEKEKFDYLHEISLREQQNAAHIVKLEAEVKGAQDDRDEEIRKKNDVIRRLQAELHQIEKFSEEHIRRVKSEAEKQESADIKNSEGRTQKLSQEASQLKTQLQNLIQEHREQEQQLRKKKFKIETEVENWIQKYDSDMGERQDEYEEIDAVYTEEKKQLHELEERFTTLEAEYLQIMEERRVARERREAAEREMALMIKSATTIQAFWRSYKVRKALKARKKKGGGKKKK